ncbi:hypothetical protein F0U60_31065 [Archangium minus]|uniref:Uncharacterized protein n=1 Tax=Archangium minus TaxID=83450 RepID=A0ABY9WY69_9BACT|nr:hypothetical protein F0U60_31065 [Archangium minus]
MDETVARVLQGSDDEVDGSHLAQSPRGIRHIEMGRRGTAQLLGERRSLLGIPPREDEFDVLADLPDVPRDGAAHEPVTACDENA